MLSREMRSNDWRINGLERKLNALSAKIDELLEEGGDGGDTGGDNTGGNEQPPSGGDNTDNCNCVSYTAGNGITINDNNAINVNYNEETMELIDGKLSVKASGDNTGGDTGSGGKLTFKLNENIMYRIVAINEQYSVYTTTQTFNGTPTAIDSVVAIYHVDNETNFTNSNLDNFTGGDWRSFLSSDYTIRVGDMLYTPDDGRPPYTIANMETNDGSKRTVFVAYSQGCVDTDPSKRSVRTIGTPASMKDRVVLEDGSTDFGGEPYFEVTADFFGTAVTADYVNRGILMYVVSDNIYNVTNAMESLDSITSDMYVMIVASGTHADAFELSYH